MDQPNKKSGEQRERISSKPSKGRKKRRSGIGGSVNTFNYILFILGISLILSAFAIVVGNDVFALVKSDKAVTLTVEKGDDFGDIASKLKDHEIIRYSWAFRLFASLKGAKELETGDYRLDAGMDYGQLISAVTGGPAYRDTVRVIIPEGFSMKQIAEELEKKKVCKEKDFFKTANTYDFAHFMLKDVPMIDNRLEGYLFPDTYDFYVGDNPVNIINKMLNNFVKKYTKSMRQLTEEKGLTIAQVVNIASLIEKEAKLPDERTTISGVIYNRLNHKDAYPFLNIDATVLYAVGHKDKLTDADLQTDSPYNTYNHEGLPPTGICNPGLSCIMAAIVPAKHSYYYYVADPKDGSHIFSKTLDQHNRAVAQVSGK